MAGTKKESEKDDKPKMTAQEAAKAILEYLRKTNRPYSPTEVSGNLKLSLAVAKKLLKDMHERQEIACCVSGKQQVYHVIQGEIPADHAERLAAQTQEIARLKGDSDALRAEEKELRAALRESVVTVPLPELKADVERREAEKDELELRLQSLKGGSLKPVDVVERERVHKRYRSVKRAVAERKRIRGQVWRLFLDANEDGNVDELKESLGLEF